MTFSIGWIIYFGVMFVLYIFYKLMMIETVMPEEEDENCFFYLGVVFWPIGLALAIYMLIFFAIIQIAKFAWVKPIEYLVGKLHKFLTKSKKTQKSG